MGKQTAELIDAIGQVMTPEAFDLFALDLGVDLQQIGAPPGVKHRALVVIEELGKTIPARHDELLVALGKHPNPILKRVAEKLLRPDFYPPGDPHDAIVLGRTAFVARDELRRYLRQFTNPSPYTNRVLIVRGSEPGGKSYSWEFLRHLATTIGARAQRLRLRRTNYSPREFLEQAYRLLLLDPATLPVRLDNPQQSKIDYLINDFKGQIPILSGRYWLVIDDLNETNVAPEIRAAAYAIASAVEEMKPDNLWVTLLGYNDEIAEPELRRVPMDDAAFPQPNLVARHLKAMSEASSNPLTSARATEIANVLFTKFSSLDRDAMFSLTELVEKMGEKLRMGVQP